MLIQYKLQPLPNNGSRSNWRSRDGSFERNFAKENDVGGGKASFARFWHPDTRSVYVCEIEVWNWSVYAGSWIIVLVYVCFICATLLGVTALVFVLLVNLQFHLMCREDPARTVWRLRWRCGCCWDHHRPRSIVQLFSFWERARARARARAHVDMNG